MATTAATKPTSVVNLPAKKIKLPPVKKSHWEVFVSRLPEAAVWLIVIAIVGVSRSLTSEVFDDRTTAWVIGLIISFALIYYTVIYQYFTEKRRRYIKDLADVIFIGILGIVAEDYSIYFFSLYILPIAAAALALDIFNSLIIAIIASLFIAGNVVLNASFIDIIEPLYYGTFQIILLVILTLFTRTLALQLRHEQEERHFYQEKLREVDQRILDIEAIEQEFVSITTHQLNTPLSIIRGYTSMLLAGDAGKLNEKQQRYITEVHGGALRLSKIIKDLLDITHLDRDTYLHHNHQPVNVKGLITKAIGRAAKKAVARHITITPHLPDRGIVIMGNSTHFEEALSNLLDNAIKYSDERTEITVELTEDKGPTGTEAVLRVIDQGIGIPIEEQPRIFQRFYRASNSEARDAQGTGLGLYIVKRIVEFHGGSISFTSEQNQGTTFTLRFPLVKIAEDATPSSLPIPEEVKEETEEPQSKPRKTVKTKPTKATKTVKTGKKKGAA